ncbi:LysR family transcriptional regulator [Sorangium sp. So ce861]|uniref:LysR family transcriptional regulator n=1 Tax=Sorangium sp. So ce861 TaxID=3133323 RepID=UPI003F5D78E3
MPGGQSATASWPELLAFVDSVRAGSFSAAAREAGKTPSAFSKRVARLEEQLKLRLLVRGAGGLQTTPEGQELYLRVQRAMEDVQEACAHAAQARAPRGLVRVSAQPDVGRDWLIPRVASFAREYPQVELELSLTDKVVDLPAERFDVALRVGEVDDGRLTRRSLGRFRSCLCAAPSYLRARGAPRTVEELAGHVLLSYLRGNRQEAWNPATKQWMTMRAPYAADSNPALRQLALDGLGIALLPELMVLEDLRRGALARLPLEGIDDEGFPISLVFPQGKQLSARVRAFVDFFADEARRSLPQPRARNP